MMLIFASVAILSVTTFLIQRFSLISLKQAYIRAIYLAQSGVHKAIYDFRSRIISEGNGYISLGEDSIDLDNYVICPEGTGNDSDYLMVDTSETEAFNFIGTFVRNFYLKNASDSNIAITHMDVSWDNNRKLIAVRIFPSIRWMVWGGLNSPVTDIPLNPPATFNGPITISSNNFLWFTNTMTGATVKVKFKMSDGSESEEIQVYPPDTSNDFHNYSFTVKSSGRPKGTDVYRTIQAKYDATSENIIEYKETNVECEAASP